MRKILFIVLVGAFVLSPVLADDGWPTVVEYKRNDGSRTEVIYDGGNVYSKHYPTVGQRAERVCRNANRIMEATGTKDSKDPYAAAGALLLSGLFIEPCTTLVIGGCILGGIAIYSVVKDVCNNGNK